MTTNHLPLIKLALTGAAGRIAYALLPRLLSGEVFGKNTKIDLRLLEIPQMLPTLKGTVMELEDCAFNLLEKITLTDRAEIAFKDLNWALLIGAKPRGPGMERNDLMRINAPIFLKQGQALAKYAAAGCHVVVVGNPANTNCLIARHHAQKRPDLTFSALTRLDQNRALFQLAKKSGKPVETIKNVIIWGNHSATQFPDISHATIDGKPINSVIKDKAWLKNDFIKNVQQRGTAVIALSGTSSAFSAANAICDHIKNFLHPSPQEEFFSAAVPSDGSYGIDENLIFSFPLKLTGGYEIVKNLPLTSFAREKIQITLEELRREREAAKESLSLAPLPQFLIN